MIMKMMKTFLDRKKTPMPTPIKLKKRFNGQFTTEPEPFVNKGTMLANITARTFQQPAPTATSLVSLGQAMDSTAGSTKSPFNIATVIPDGQLQWYGSYGFIGYTTCAILAQHWLISKACLMPAEDAVRKGYDVTVNDGTEVDEEVLDAIRLADVKYKINEELIRFIQMGRVFGIRIAMFVVDSSDPKYYEKPFNPDGVTPGSYRGITQVDPYWMSPQLDAEASGNPASRHFYEPTWWRINTIMVHRSHLIICRTEELPDILKPTYFYGGVSIPQKISERVYAAERTANEAPMLTMTKRLDVLTTDMTKAAAKPGKFVAALQKFVFNRDNYGIKTIGLDEKMEQYDTALADLDNVIMTQFQLVSAACGVPSTKLLGTSPKGFNTTGEFEESSYHEFLESQQTIWGTPLLNRHHLLLIRSEIAPQFGIESFSTTATWNKLDAMTEKELADCNKVKADTGAVLVSSGAIDGADERARVISDPESGYSGIPDEVPEVPEQIESDPEYG